MLKESNLPLEDDGPELPKTPTADQNDFSNEVNALHEACESLYTSAHNTKLSTIMLLMNVCHVHGVSNNF
jgi:hypothetical protein